MDSEKGLSPLISSVLLVGIVIVSTAIVMSQLLPSMKTGTEMGALDAGKQSISSFDQAVQDIIYEAPGAKRVVKFRTTSGKFRISGKEDMIQFSVDTSPGSAETGAITKEGRMTITSGPKLKAYESDINGDGSVDLVIENDAVRFAVRKLNNRSSQGWINLTNSSAPFITLMENRRLSVNTTPMMGIYINDMNNTSYGQGYTELVETGDDLEEAAIMLYLNATDAGMAYEAFFRLLPGADFVQAEVKLR